MIKKKLAFQCRKYNLYVKAKNITNSFIYKTETDSQTQKTNLWLPKGEGSRDELGVWNEQIHTTKMIFKLSSGRRE